VQALLHLCHLGVHNLNSALEKSEQSEVSKFQRNEGRQGEARKWLISRMNSLLVLPEDCASYILAHEDQAYTLITFWTRAAKSHPLRKDR
jgi:hypothetical protein